MTARPVLFLLLLLPLAACGEPEPLRTPDWVEGRWRVALTVPGGELPFMMNVAQRDGLAATIVNGEERITTRDVGLLGNRVVIDLNVFNSTIDARLEQNGLVGTVSIVREGGRQQVIPLRATKGTDNRFPDLGITPTVDVTGRWEVVFRTKSGERTPAVGEFKQNGSLLLGTFLTKTGDYRYLAGDVQGNEIRLSCFDGYHAFLFHAEVQDDGVMRGDFWSGTHWHETWTAVRNENAKLPDANALTFLKPGFDRLNFSFPDTSGNLVSFSDSRFDGKVVLVSVSGTWCPNCHDEAAFLRQLYDDYHEEGLDIVSLMYEHVEGFEAAARQVNEFQKWHDIPYHLLVAGTSNKVEASKTLPMLNQVIAYPTTIFVDRDRQIRKIHTGFTGPGTGEHYSRLVREYREYVEFLLAEPAEDLARSTNRR
ncbi:MAG: TlpA family protein disulfide reductase [Rhodothermia bacterium]|nr:TlpA family protein disulfide reductase [Rhodothermia bacterium]